ncbi:MAG: ABC transporter ATP-binding protein [Candidatus Omnitrophica bacterium]|nr:ABC transporter ATP-binding protein [Candidatus Omnitrophota bacterium]
MLKVRDLHKVYREGSKEVYAIRGVNLEVNKGDISVIIGPSGAGKSTLLHLLGGLDIPSAGSVLLDNIDLYKISDSRRSKLRNKKIGFVFQFYHLLPEFTALENVMLPSMVGGRKRSKKAAELLETVGLKDRMDHRPAQLSGGESQRVAVARALINDPEIVFCDEPTGNLDSRMSEEVRNLIWKLNRENDQTFVIATHEPLLAQRAQRALYIKDGMLKGD